MSITSEHRLTVGQIRWKCPLESIPAETTEGVEPVEGIIGQDRALKALKLGVELNSPGYNVFVCGLSGTGKATTIQTILEKIQPFRQESFDYCYVHNFQDEDRPWLLRFEAGQGTEFRNDMSEALELLKDRISKVFDDKEYMNLKQALIEEFNKKETDLFVTFEHTIAPDGFVLGKVQEGQVVHPEIFAKINDQAVLLTDLSAKVQEGIVTEEQAQILIDTYRSHHLALQEVFRQALQLSRSYQKLIAEQERNFVSMIVNAIFTELLENYPDEKISSYLALVIESVLKNLDRFKPVPPGEEAEDDPFTEFTVNLLLDNKGTSVCPVIVETTPNFTNLFGTIEKRQDVNGFWFTDFTMIKAGSLLRADGGFLVLNAADAISEPGVWRMLQRVLLYRKLEIQSIETMTQQSSSAMKPEAIDVNVKVILIGNNEIYSVLDAYERDFKKIFKVKADFDYEMENSELAVKQYAALVRKLITDEGLKHFDNKAIATIVEYGARLAGSRKKLTTQFSEIADIIREANYWCQQNSNRYVTNDHVDKAIRETRNRHGLSEDKLQEMIDTNVIMIDVTGSRVGQINGLAVYEGDRFAFGKPTRITASTSAGRTGIINIEREAKLSGRTHDKGVLILAGFLRETFAQHAPLTLSASVSFEQSYSGIDGDSASSTELYALLSSLSGVPISQELAVTGSVNQKGDIQPIGGVNEKVEGFFEVCRKKGLTGSQGVIIPIQNVSDLMLLEDVVTAVRESRFHLYSIGRIEEGIELLTGVSAGERDASGKFPIDSVFGKVAVRLEELAHISSKKKKKETK